MVNKYINQIINSGEQKKEYKLVIFEQDLLTQMRL